jgi:hypothetical protein
MQLFLLFLREAFVGAFKELTNDDMYILNEDDAPNLIEMKIMFALVQLYYYLHHAIKKGDSKMIFAWMKTAIQIFKAAKKPHYTQLSIDFTIRYESWCEKIISMLNGAMFVLTSTGIFQSLDEFVEFVNLHSKSRDHKTDCPNFGANVSSSSYMRMRADDLIYGLQEMRGLTDKTHVSQFTPKQQDLIEEMTKIIVTIWPIVCDTDIMVCNILNDDPKLIATPPSELIKDALLKVPDQVKERSMVFEKMFQNELNAENPTLNTVNRTSEELLESERELAAMRELDDENALEETDDDEEEEFALPKTNEILAKLKSRRSLLISMQRIHSRATEDRMHVEEVRRVTLEESEERPAKRVLRKRTGAIDQSE